MSACAHSNDDDRRTVPPNAGRMVSRTVAPVVAIDFLWWAIASRLQRLPIGVQRTDRTRRKTRNRTRRGDGLIDDDVNTAEAGRRWRRDEPVREDGTITRYRWTSSSAPHHTQTEVGISTSQNHTHARRNGREHPVCPSSIFQHKQPIGSPSQHACQKHGQTRCSESDRRRNAPGDRTKPIDDGRHIDAVRTQRPTAHATTVQATPQMPHHRPPPTVACLLCYGRPTAPPRSAPIATPTRYAIRNDAATAKALHECYPTHTRRGCQRADRRRNSGRQNDRQPILRPYESAAASFDLRLGASKRPRKGLRLSKTRKPWLRRSF
jgi:hypothetical protein